MWQNWLHESRATFWGLESRVDCDAGLNGGWGLAFPCLFLLEAHCHSETTVSLPSCSQLVSCIPLSLFKSPLTPPSNFMSEN